MNGFVILLYFCLQQLKVTNKIKTSLNPNVSATLIGDHFGSCINKYINKHNI